MGEKVAIIGIGQTEHRYHRTDINAEEMVNIAVRRALEDAQLTIKDIDAVVSENMDFLEGHYAPDCMLVDGSGGWMKPGFRIQTGGTGGGSVVSAGCNTVGSGVFNKVLVIAWQKHDAVNTNAAISATRDPLYDRFTNVGASSLFSSWGSRYMQETGCPEEIAALSRSITSEGASRNPCAHVQRRVSVEEVMNSRILVWPLRLLHMSPTSCGCVALVLANGQLAKKISKKPVWIKDFVIVHREQSVYRGGAVEVSPDKYGIEVAVQKLYKRNGIMNPAKEIDVWETYTPSSWADMPFIELRYICEKGQAWKLIEKEKTRFDREIPWNPSGGVVCTNPIGASGAIRIAEAALQIRGEAGEHQVSKNVKLAEADAWGGSHWSAMFLLSKSI
jgi:acetyl-CoA C-acetyltransferase